MLLVRLRIITCVLIFCSCASKQYIINTDGYIVDSVSTYRNDSKEFCFYFDHYHTQKGYLPLTKGVRKILSNCEFNAKSDTVLFIGVNLICVERYSVPSYLKTQKDDKRKYQLCPLLEIKDNDPFGPVSEAGFHCMNHHLNKLPNAKDVKKLLSSSSFIRNVRIYKYKKSVVIEDLIPFENHHIAMVYLRKKRTGKKHSSWEYGSLEEDPTEPYNLLNRETIRWKYDFDLRLTRENGMRLKLRMNPDSLCRWSSYH